MERLNYIYNNGKQICALDLSGCSDTVFFQAIEDIKKTISLQSDHSLLVMLNLTDSPFNDDVMLAVEKFIAFIGTYSEKIAIIGISGLRKVVLESAIRMHSKKLAFIEDENAAKTWVSE